MAAVGVPAARVATGALCVLAVATGVGVADGRGVETAPFVGGTTLSVPLGPSAQAWTITPAALVFA